MNASVDSARENSGQEAQGHGGIALWQPQQLMIPTASSLTILHQRPQQSMIAIDAPLTRLPQMPQQWHQPQLLLETHHHLHIAVQHEAIVDSSIHPRTVSKCPNNIWQRLKTLRDRYQEEVQELFATLTKKKAVPMPPEQLQKLKHYKDLLRELLPYLNSPRDSVPDDLSMEKLDALEKQISTIMDSYKRCRQLLAYVHTARLPHLVNQTQQR